MLFWMKSPALMRTSPRARTISTSSRTSSASSAVSTRLTEPSVSLTTGGSMESTGVMAADLPGSSMRSWTPVVRNLLRMTIVAGWMPTAARPVFRALPYLSLKPPVLPGKLKTGRPTMISSMKPAVGFSSSSSESLCPSLESQSHPSSPSLWQWPMSFWALPTMPSTTTMRAPPLSLLVSMPGMSL